MKPKTSGRGRPPKTKIVKKELALEETTSITPAYPAGGVQPSVEIAKCISYQKFRYSGENRPGKKYQEKEFMTLRLNHLSDKVVRIVIICTDAENKELIHPNGLVGKDCHDGIYDKEYAITKAQYNVKIPYLRTERIKTKKNEHEKIKSVLHDRALHLPTPYRERCLSQCTDKYTATRKFDTTKVCLGVIVTVLSHQGHFNGSLHAISHVVRNASEKTILGIHKLSQESVQSGTGAEIDIFTTEDGPAIEPGKCFVFVSCNLEHGESWSSEKFIPDKEDILYKRVIRYPVPVFEPYQHLPSPMEAILHLECPQSNQYCTCPLTFLPPQGMVVIDERGYSLKRTYPEHEDIKPCPKRLRHGIAEDVRSTDSIKASLKTKLKARQVDYPTTVDSEYAASPSQPQDGEQLIISHQGSHYEMYEQSQPQVLVHHHDPSTGESSVLLDMDGGKSNGSDAAVVVEDENHVPMRQISLERLPKSHVKQLISAGKGNQFQGHGPDVQVVAAGYSDAVPPNTTVYIYTTNGGIPADHVAIDEATGEQLVLQEIDGEHLMIAGEADIMKNISQNQVEELENASELRTGTVTSVSEQPVFSQPLREISSRRQVASKHISATTGGKQLISKLSMPEHAAKGSDQSVAKDRSGQKSVTRSDARNLSSIPSSSVSNVSSTSVSNVYSNTVTSSATGIPPLTRILIPNKSPSKSSAASPWEVEGDEDAAMASYILVSGGIYDTNSKTAGQTVDVKSERDYRERYSAAQGATLPQASGDADQRKEQRVGAVHQGEQNASEVSATGTQPAGRNSEAAAKGSLTSMELHLTKMIVDTTNPTDNLSTMHLAEFAEHFEEKEREAQREAEVIKSKESPVGPV
ncbi:uncharacterized protein LOC101862242 [Aplysia californica]|uniref:Uncharacterized protein LOC101862242 n=1 Tax=Aplysia californica TaxID=6500 RepID=A0ABM0KAI9_APLCA|nr:uncharacterized protein LOC101862242 [Aplysia californica]